MTAKASLAAFTLLELLVVLTLFSLMAGLALPRLTQIQSSFQRATDKDEILMQIADIGYRVVQRGYGGRLQPVHSLAPASASSSTQSASSQETPFAHFELPISLPAGWTLDPKQELIYLDNGVCLGGEIRAVSERDTFTITLLAPYCQPESIR